MAATKSFGERIIQRLLDDKLITQDQVNELLEEQKKTKVRLVKLLEQKNLVSEMDRISAVGAVLSIAPIDVSKLRMTSELTDLIPSQLAKNFSVIPVSKLGNRLFLAMADPLNVLALDDIRKQTKMEVIPLISTPSAIKKKLEDFQNSDQMMDSIIQESNGGGEDTIEAVTETKQDSSNLDLSSEMGAGDAPVIKLVNLILLEAIKTKTSDIHIEPFEKYIKLRYRIDGVLLERKSPPKAMQNAMMSRLKIMSNLDIAEKRLPQDGRLRVKVSGKDIDLRISFLPTVHGEKCVLRVLDKSNLSLSMDALGLEPETFKQVKDAVDSPHGLILVTGPTGSGKTTTLYSILHELNQPGDNIITVEDPVEFQIEGINQVSVAKAVGLTFAAALRSILRQDPDIVMIGEIRDKETAEIAVEASLTGHQVLSTLHCNDAPGAISRLDDMGIAPFLISSAVLLSSAQRLMRRICKVCKTECPVDPKVAEQAGVDLSYFSGFKTYKGRGCERCNNTGYSGRLAILEAMTMSDELRKLVIQRASGAELKHVAVDQGMKTLRMAGLQKVRDGLTTVEQVLITTASH